MQTGPPVAKQRAYVFDDTVQVPFYAAWAMRFVVRMQIPAHLLRNRLERKATRPRHSVFSCLSRGFLCRSMVTSAFTDSKKVVTSKDWILLESRPCDDSDVVMNVWGSMGHDMNAPATLGLGQLGNHLCIFHSCCIC